MNVQDLANQLGELIGEGKGTWPIYLRLVNDADPPVRDAIDGTGWGVSEIFADPGLGPDNEGFVIVYGKPEETP